MFNLIIYLLTWWVIQKSYPRGWYDFKNFWNSWYFKYEIWNVPCPHINLITNRKSQKIERRSQKTLGLSDIKNYWLINMDGLVWLLDKVWVARSFSEWITCIPLKPGKLNWFKLSHFFPQIWNLKQTNLI